MIFKDINWSQDCKLTAKRRRKKIKFNFTHMDEVPSFRQVLALTYIEGFYK